MIFIKLLRAADLYLSSTDHRASKARSCYTLYLRGSDMMNPRIAGIWLCHGRVVNHHRIHNIGCLHADCEYLPHTISLYIQRTSLGIYDHRSCSKS
jgi:hypothetical protein